MIPARMGSQRLKQKNLRELGGIPLITRAIRKAKDSGVFGEVWVNSEDDAFGAIAKEEGVQFHRRPAELANNTATSEQCIRLRRYWARRGLRNSCARWNKATTTRI